MRSTYSSKSLEKHIKRQKRRIKARSTYFIKESNLNKWLAIALFPFFIMIIAAMCSKQFAVWLPSFSMY